MSERPDIEHSTSSFPISASGRDGRNFTISCCDGSHFMSEAWGPPQFQEKRSRSEKAILGALGAFRGILGATLGIRNSILGIRNSILGMASHDLSNTKTAILGATPGAIPRIDGNPHEIFSFAPPFSERFFENWGGPRAQDHVIAIYDAL